MNTDNLGVYIVIDRSGSMVSIWNELLNSVNLYVKELAPSTEVTVAVFDTPTTDMEYVLIRKYVKAGEFTPINADEIKPRGTTPLLSALERMLNRLDEDGHSKSILISVTDGAENASRNVTRDQIKAKLNRVKEKSTEVIFFGANFADIEKEAGSLGIGKEYAVNMTTANFEAVTRGLSAKTNAYAASGAAMSYSVAEKAEAVKDK